MIKKLIVTDNKEKYYYYKLVIVILLYNLNIYYNLKDNDELFEILDEEGDNIIEKYESDLYDKMKLKQNSTYGIIMRGFKK